MTAIKQTLFKACPLHPDEPIIRASLDIKSPKLLYCQECMEDLANSIQTGLFKFSHVGDKLYEQLSKKYAEYQHSLPSASPKEYQDKIESFITEQKARTDQEFVKIQTEVLELLTTSKNEVYKTLDKIKMNLLTDCEVSVEKVKNFPDPKIFEGKDITKDEIYKEIEGNKESVEDIEKKIRARLETMKQLDEIKEETTIGLSRHEKVKLLETLPLTNPKDPDFYKNSLKGLSPYIQALIFERDETKADEKSSIISSGQNNLLEVLTQSVQACQNSLEKTKDRVAGFVEGIVGLYYTDSIIDGKAVTESTNMNSNRNPYYDEPDNISSSSSEGKLYDDGYFDYEEEF